MCRQINSFTGAAFDDFRDFSPSITKRVHRDPSPNRNIAVVENEV